ncbi:Telomeric repeat-binding factor 2-interacting protein 1 [Balamuthia mandrillaris]
MHASQGTSAAAGGGNASASSSGLFTVDGKPMGFYVPPSTSKAKIVGLIESNGGRVNTRWNNHLITLVDPGTTDLSRLSSRPNIRVFSLAYVLDSVQAGQLQDLQRYALRPPQTPFSPTRVAYTAEEDQKILEYVRTRSPIAIKGKLFWQELEASGILPGRTWQSLRDHYLKKLQPYRDDPLSQEAFGGAGGEEDETFSLFPLSQPPQTQASTPTATTPLHPRQQPSTMTPMLFAFSSSTTSNTPTSSQASSSQPYLSVPVSPSLHTQPPELDEEEDEGPSPFSSSGNMVTSASSTTTIASKAAHLLHHHHVHSLVGRGGGAAGGAFPPLLAEVAPHALFDEGGEELASGTVIQNILSSSSTSSGTIEGLAAPGAREGAEGTEERGKKQRRTRKRKQIDLTGAEQDGTTTTTTDKQTTKKQKRRRSSRRRLDFADVEGRKWLLSSLELLKRKDAGELKAKDLLRLSEGEQSALEVLRLMRQTKKPFKVVLHALISHNGHVNHARRYLLHPAAKSLAKPWTPLEDDAVRGHNRGLMEELMNTRGMAALATRYDYLHGLESTA